MRPAQRVPRPDTVERSVRAEGLDATGIDRVIAEAGVARMTLNDHFASEAILERPCSRYLRDPRRAIAARGGQPPVNALVSVLDPDAAIRNLQTMVTAPRADTLEVTS